MKIEKNKEFIFELTTLINKHRIENIPDTPDFILADYLYECIDVFARYSKAKERWYGKELDILTNE